MDINTVSAPLGKLCQATTKMLMVPDQMRSPRRAGTHNGARRGDGDTGTREGVIGFPSSAGSAEANELSGTANEVSVTKARK